MRKSFTAGGVLAAAAAALTLVGFAAPAAAATIHSENIAGYVAFQKAAITAATGTINVPTVTCPGTGTVYINGGVTLTDQRKSAKYVVQMGWDISCTAGTVSYENGGVGFCPATGGYCPTYAYFPIAPGNSIQVSMSQDTATNTTTLTADNVTKHQTASCSMKLSLLITETFVRTYTYGSSAGNVTPIPSFTGIHYGGFKLNGALLSTLSPTKYEMYDGATLQVSTTAISSNGTFSTLFEHA